MLFNSLPYAIFLVVVFILYWVLPHKFRWIMLLLASYYFYMSWNPELVVLIAFTTLVSYGCALLMDRARRAGGRQAEKLPKLYLTLTLVICFGILFFFKYFNFFSDSVTAVLRALSLPIGEFTLKLVLPVGISFYTFQTLSYVIDVYRGSIPAERHLGIYALFVSFFPQLVAGPIERPENLIPQFRTERKFQSGEAADGLKWIAWGLFKKMVIADSLAVYVNMVYGNLAAYTGLPFIVATVFFAIQIYCDFSAYSNIATGSARLLGIRLMKNFDSPYFSFSVREFWNRWHISLSTWFRDYLYIPLGGNRVGFLRHLVNLMITFLVSGLWHGANWTFVIWGGLHGLYMVTGCLWRKLVPQREVEKPQGRMAHWLSGAAKLLFTFALVCFAWIFFRAESLPDAMYGIRHMFDGISSPIRYVADAARALGIDRYDLLWRLLPVALLTVVDAVQRKRDVMDFIRGWNPVFRWVAYVVLVWLVLFYPSVGGSAEFIYFQF